MTSRVPTRTGIRGDLDLVTGCDLGDPATQRAINHSLDICNVLVAIVQPNCRTTGRNSYYNSMMHYDTWQSHHQEGLPPINYCGHVAHTQIKKGRYFLREQPEGTWIDHIPPWTAVSEATTVYKITMDQCMVGCKDEYDNPV